MDTTPFHNLVVAGRNIEKNIIDDIFNKMNDSKGVKVGKSGYKWVKVGKIG